MLEILLRNAISDRRLMEDHLPIESSLLVFDILTIISLHTVIGDPLNHKRLLLSLPYSPNGIRKQLYKLVCIGYIQERRSNIDTRVIYLVSSDLALEKISNYLNMKLLLNQNLID